jgi:hypothetical protein
LANKQAWANASTRVMPVASPLVLPERREG